MQKPQGGGKFLVQIPGVRGGMVMDEIDTCITNWGKENHLKDKNSQKFKPIKLTSLFYDLETRGFPKTEDMIKLRSQRAITATVRI